MTTAEIAQLLTGIAALVAAVAAIGGWVSNCILGKRNSRKIDAGTAVSTSNSDKLDASHGQMNQRMDELIDMNRKDATAIEKQRGVDER